jgi:hypothetical protein
MIPGGYNQNVQLFQTRGYVVILNEMVHNARIIPLDGRPHGIVRQWLGDSRGRWEGDTLVVDTVNFTDKGTGTMALESQPGVVPAWGAQADANLHLVERFRRVDANTLLYEFTMDDPTIWTRPWSAQIPMTKLQAPIYEYACHEGNYGLIGILGGARAEEKAAEEAVKKGAR